LGAPLFAPANVVNKPNAMIGQVILANAASQPRPSSRKLLPARRQSLHS
jgi:hypothetical protein